MMKRILSLLLALVLLAGLLPVCAERADAVANGVSEDAFAYLTEVCRTKGTLRDDAHYVFTVDDPSVSDVWKFRFEYDPSAETVSITGVCSRDVLKPDGSLQYVTELPRPRLVICPAAASPMTAQVQLYGNKDGAMVWALMGESYLSKRSEPFVSRLTDFDAYYPDIYGTNLEQLSAMHPEANIDTRDEQHWNLFHYHVGACHWMTAVLQKELEPGGFRWQELAPDSPPPHTGKGVNGAFSDVQMKDFYYGPVLWCALNDVTQGTGPTTFSPKKTCTRAEVVTFLWRAAGCPEPTATATEFRDVDLSKWYGKAVLWAVEQGITNGVDKTHFGPDLGCTRGHVVTFLARARKGAPSGAAGSQFADVRPGAYYYDAVLWAVEQHITQGVTWNRFAPNDVCTRGQIATFLFRAYASADDLFEPVDPGHDFA